MRAILINPYDQTVTEIDTTGLCDGMGGFYAILTKADPMFCSALVERIQMGTTVDVWFDEEANLTDGRPVFQFTGGQQISGAAILLAHDDGGASAPLPDWLTLERVAASVEWTELVTSGDFGEATTKDVDHPVFGKTRAIICGDAQPRTSRGYFVYCDGDHDEGTEPVRVLATSVLFNRRGDALAYAKTINDKRKPTIHEAGI